MAKEKKTRGTSLPPELLTEWDERYAETTRLLEERIAYHRAKLAEERERKQQRPWWRYWRTGT